nr:hypothetical protein Iba_chr07bCG14480 [Ipomoea batatas]
MDSWDCQWVSLLLVDYALPKHRLFLVSRPALDIQLTNNTAPEQMILQLSQHQIGVGHQFVFHFHSARNCVFVVYKLV